MLRLLILILFLTSIVFAAGEKGGGGGDPGKIAQQLKEEKIEAATHAFIWFFVSGPGLGQESYLSHLSSILSKVDPDYIFDKSAKKVFVDMLNRGLLKDVALTQVKLKEKCIIYRDDVPVEVTAGTLMDIPQSEVCINPYRFVDSTGGVLKESLFLGFMLHEYAHHYGYLDLDHSFGVAMTEAIELSSNADDKDLLEYFFKQTRYLHKVDHDKPYIQKWNQCVRERDCLTPKPAAGVTIITH